MCRQAGCHVTRRWYCCMTSLTVHDLGRRWRSLVRGQGAPPLLVLLLLLFPLLMDLLLLLLSMVLLHMSHPT